METRLNRIVENTRSIGVMAQAGLEPSASEVLSEESQYLKDMYYIYESARRAPLATAISPMLLPIRSNLYPDGPRLVQGFSMKLQNINESNDQVNDNSRSFRILKKLKTHLAHAQATLGQSTHGNDTNPLFIW
jgi:hypothetical protein